MIELVSFDELRVSAIGGDSGLRESSISHYPRLEYIISSVYSAIEIYTQRILEFGNYSYSSKNHQSRMVKLDAIPITSVEVIDNYTSITLEEETDYEITDYGIRLLNKTSNLTVNYSGGFTNLTVPDNFKRAAYYQIQSEYMKRDSLDGSYLNNYGGSIRRPPIELLGITKSTLDSVRHPLFRGY